MASPGRTLPPRAAKSLARGGIYSTVLQDHPRSTGQSCEGSDAHPVPHVPPPTRPQSREATERPRRGRPVKNKHRNVPNVSADFPSADSYTDAENSQAGERPLTPQTDREGQSGSRSAGGPSQSLEQASAVLVQPTPAHPVPGMAAPNLENLLKNFSQNLITIFNGQSQATETRDGEVSGVTPEHTPEVSSENPSTMVLPRQVGVARGSNVQTS